MKYEIVRGEKRIPLTDQELMEAYHIQELRFRIQDVKDHADELGIKVDENDCEAIAKKILTKYDCNIAENCLMDAAIIEFAQTA